MRMLHEVEENSVAYTIVQEGMKNGVPLSTSETISSSPVLQG